jgi:hypothetical protein
MAQKYNLKPSLIKIMFDIAYMRGPRKDIETKAKEILNWKPKYSFQDLVKEMVVKDIEKSQSKKISEKVRGRFSMTIDKFNMKEMQGQISLCKYHREARISHHFNREVASSR